MVLLQNKTLTVSWSSSIVPWHLSVCLYVPDFIVTPERKPAESYKSTWKQPTTGNNISRSVGQRSRSFTRYQINRRAVFWRKKLPRPHLHRARISPLSRQCRWPHLSKSHLYSVTWPVSRDVYLAELWRVACRKTPWRAVAEPTQFQRSRKSN